MATSKAQRAKVAERRTRAIQLRLGGADWQSIADRLGYASRGAACTDVNRALEQQLVEQAAAVETMREIESARLDRLQATLWPQALSGDIRAIETVLRIFEQRRKLWALDRPAQVEVFTMDAIDAEIRRLQEALAHTPVGDAA